MTVFILKDNGRIVGYNRSPFVVGENQTQEESPLSFEEYSDRLKLLASQLKINANGQDGAVVTVYTNTSATAIDLLINEAPITVSITDHTGILPVIVADTPGVIEIRPFDETLFSAAGQGSLIIEAV